MTELDSCVVILYSPLNSNYLQVDTFKYSQPSQFICLSRPWCTLLTRNSENIHMTSWLILINYLLLPCLGCFVNLIQNPLTGLTSVVWLSDMLSGDSSTNNTSLCACGCLWSCFCLRDHNRTSDETKMFITQWPRN